MIYRFIYSFFTICASLCSAFAQTTSAEQILSRLRTKMEESAALEMHFTLSGDGMESFQGTIYAQDANFVMSSPQVEVYVSGPTKWIYSVGINEVMVMPHDPAVVDIFQNPLSLFSSNLSKEYKVSDKPVYVQKEGREVTEISLTPTGKGVPYTLVVLRLDRQSQTPQSIQFDAKDGSRFEVSITGYKPLNKPFSPEYFTFPTQKHPEVYVTDLR